MAYRDTRNFIIFWKWGVGGGGSIFRDSRISHYAHTESRMLVFYRGYWKEIPMPNYVDPAWVWGDRQKAATIICHEMEAGATWSQAWCAAEVAIYGGLSISGKQHGAPQNQKEDERVEEES
jgi:hypothetical protein